MTKRLGAMLVVMLLGAIAAAQVQQGLGDYLDVFTVQVKPEKRAEFDAINAKMVAANRQNKGDTWLAMETMYGPGNRVTFISTRTSYGDIEAAMGAFYGAMGKALGKAGTDKVFQDFNECILSSRSEIRRRRWDLSSNAPTDAAAYAKFIADSRYLRTVAVHVKPGEAPAFEDLLKDLKAAREKANLTAFVSQAVAGQEGTVYYITTLEPNLAGYDSIPTAQKLLGDEGYAKYLKVTAETVSDSETVINHFLPEISNPPEPIVAAAPDFWKPKMAVAKAAKAPATNAAEKEKMGAKDKQ